MAEAYKEALKALGKWGHDKFRLHVSGVSSIPVWILPNTVARLEAQTECRELQGLHSTFNFPGRRDQIYKGCTLLCLQFWEPQGNLGRKKEKWR